MQAPSATWCQETHGISTYARTPSRHAGRPREAPSTPVTPPPPQEPLPSLPREGERRALETKKHAKEVQFLKRTNAQLKKELEAYLSPTKK